MMMFLLLDKFPPGKVGDTLEYVYQIQLKVGCGGDVNHDNKTQNWKFSWEELTAVMPVTNLQCYPCTGIKHALVKVSAQQQQIYLYN